MTKANPQISAQIEDMRARLNENAEHEQALLRALSEALGQVDQQLLNEVRQVTAEHEARRSDILGELHVLASRLCVFPKPISSDAPRAREQVTALNSSPRNGKAAHAPGDWRQAASSKQHRRRVRSLFRRPHADQFTLMVNIRCVCSSLSTPAVASPHWLKF